MCPTGRAGQRCWSATEGVAAVASTTGPVPELGGLALGPGWGAPTERFLRVLPGATGARLPCPRARRSRRPRCACSLHLSTAKPLGIYLSLSVSGCARLCLCAHRRLCVCACLCLCMYLGLCLSVCGCWSLPVRMTVSGFVCV